MQRGAVMPWAMAALGAALLAWLSGVEGHLLAGVSTALLAALFIINRSPQAFWGLVIGGWVFVGIQTEWQRQLPLGLSGQDLKVSARVVDVQPLEGASRLVLDIDRCQSPAYLPNCHHLKRVRVSDYSDTSYQAGERWQLVLRLRPPRGFSNPGAFDYAQWLWREGIHATGYVRPSLETRRLTQARPTLRGLAREKISATSLAPQTKRWLAALSLGDSRQLTQDDWALLNATGTTHLVVISGLHVGLIASLTLLLGRLIARLATPSNWRLRTWPWWVAGAACVGYAALAGMGPPAMRAMVMTLLGLWVLSGRHAPGPWQAWWLALLLIVLLDPLAIWRPGLWLSFVAVGWLIVIWQGRARPRGVKGWCWALVRTQLLLAPLMAAAVLLAFGRVAPGAPLVNLLAVPWVSSIMVPAALLGWLVAPLPGASAVVWWIFEQALGVFHGLLSLTLGVLPLWEPSAALKYPLSAALLLVALCWGLAFVPRLLRAGSLVAAITLALAHPVGALAPNELRVTVFDVG